MGSMEARDTRQDLKMAPGTALPSETVPVMVQNEAYVSKVVGRACDASFAMAAVSSELSSYPGYFRSDWQPQHKIEYGTNVYIARVTAELFQIASVKNTSNSDGKKCKSVKTYLATRVGYKKLSRTKE